VASPLAVPGGEYDNTYLGLNISATGNFHKAVNNLIHKARRAFYTIKMNIKFNTPN
jgi:hypothetical protein